MNSWVLGRSAPKGFFDATIFNPNASSYQELRVSSLYTASLGKTNNVCEYEESIREVEMASFTPLVFQPLVV